MTRSLDGLIPICPVSMAVLLSEFVSPENIVMVAVFEKVVPVDCCDLSVASIVTTRD